jgi:hypothetical protein
MSTFVCIFIHPLLTASCRHNDRYSIYCRADAEEYVTLIFNGRTIGGDNEEFQH